MAEILLDGQRYNAVISLFNPDGDTYEFTWQSIQELVIIDNILKWHMHGSMVYKSVVDSMERKIGDNESIDLDTSLTQEERIQLKKEPYVFSNNGRDRLYIRLEPIMNEKDVNTPKIKTSDNWILENVFCVYDREELPAEDNENRRRKLHFVDEDFFLMQEARMQWSSATSPLNPFSTSNQNILTEDERAMPTGLAIRSILETANLKPDTEYFDAGSNKIFYSTYGNASIHTAISYLLNQHVSTYNKDICLFCKDRTSGKYTLIPISTYNAKAGYQPDNPLEWQIEHFILSSKVPNYKTPTFHAPIINDNSFEIDSKQTTIDKFLYVDGSAIGHSKLLATPIVITHNPSKTFIIDPEAIPDNIEKFIKNEYLKGKLYTSDNPELSVPFTDFQRSLVNKQLMYSVTSTPEDRRSTGFSHILFSKLFESGCIVINTPGRLFRRSGRFFGLDRVDYSINPFDFKFTGQWFTTSVEHVFHEKTYSTTITGVKLYKF